MLILGSLLASLQRRLALRWRRFGRGRHRDSASAALHSARATMRRKSFCVLTTLGTDGPSARVVEPFRAEPDFSVWFGTSIASRKVAELRANPAATLVYEDDARGACVVLVGRAEVIDALDERRQHWKPAWWAFFPDGPETADYALLHFKPQRLEVWDALRGVTPDPFGLRSAQLSRVDDSWQLV
jgi:general stress protein 26